MKCKHCNGTGRIQWEDEIEDCKFCGGTGKVMSLSHDDSQDEDYADHQADAAINFWKDINQHFEI